MKLLFDQNVSPRLASQLADLYPGSSHLFLLELDRASDEVVWTYARANEYIVVTKDADFPDLILVRGSPPKVIWLRMGNCTTQAVERTLRLHYSAVEELHRNPDASVLTLF